jgi:hypothetical protein
MQVHPSDDLMLVIFGPKLSFLPWGGVKQSPLRKSATIGPIRPAQDNECLTVGGMRIGRGNRSIGRKFAPVPLHPPQILHIDLGSNHGRRGEKPAINRLTYGLPETFSGSH